MDECKYCFNEKNQIELVDLPIADLMGSKNHNYEFRIIYDNDIGCYALHMESTYNNASIKINYCPICGRKLVNE